MTESLKEQYVRGLLLPEEQVSRLLPPKTAPDHSYTRLPQNKVSTRHFRTVNVRGIEIEI